MLWNKRKPSVRTAVCLTIAGVLLATVAWAKPLPVPALTGRVVDRARALRPAEAARVETAIRALEGATGGQAAVLLIPTLGEADDLEGYSMRVAESWKLGKKGRDDGLLILVVLDDRLLRLEVGYGWEGSVNDARAGAIADAMIPFMREGRMADALVYAVQRVQAHVTGSEPAEALQPPVAEPAAGSSIPDAAFLVIVLIFVALNVFFGRRRGFFMGGGGGFRGGGGFGGGGGGFRGGGGGFGGGGASRRW